MNAAQHKALLYANASGATFSSWVMCGFTWRTIFHLRDIGLLRMGERCESRTRRVATWRITAAGRRALAQIKARRGVFRTIFNDYAEQLNTRPPRRVLRP